MASRAYLYEEFSRVCKAAGVPISAYVQTPNNLDHSTFIHTQYSKHRYPMFRFVIGGEIKDSYPQIYFIDKDGIDAISIDIYTLI